MSGNNDMNAQMPVWRGLFEWSMSHSDGTKTTDAKEMDPERYQFLSSALQHYVVDLPKRLKEITTDISGSLANTESLDENLQKVEGLMDELLDIVHDLDYAKDLHSIGGMPMLLKLLSCPHASLRWRAAEVVGTCVQNNAKVQLWFQQGGALPLLTRLLSDSDPKVLAKALYALGSLVRNNREGLDALRAGSPYAMLVELMGHSDERVVRKAVQLVQYLLQNSKEDRAGFVAVPKSLEALKALLDSEDTDIRLHALQSLFAIVRDPESRRAVTKGEFFTALRESNSKLAAKHAAFEPEDKEAFRDEIVACSVLLAALGKLFPPS